MKDILRKIAERKIKSEREERIWKKGDGNGELRNMIEHRAI